MKTALDETQARALREQVAEIAAAYLSSAKVEPAQVPGVIAQIAASLGALHAGESADPVASAVARPTPAQIRASITDGWLISFENGKRYKTLKRHLTERGMTPFDYRVKWGLPLDYPMVSPSFHKRRAALSRDLQLGQKGALALARRKAGAADRKG